MSLKIQCYMKNEQGMYFLVWYGAEADVSKNEQQTGSVCFE